MRRHALSMAAGSIAWQHRRRRAESKNQAT